ncbi:MAG TPA: OB-fold domain-containing protein, partial [Candidatus Bathyarchaeia archaeon]
VAADASRLKKPLLVAVVELDGASPGMGILHTLGEVEPYRVKIGMRVRAVWKPVEERGGAITDIRYFKPVEEA